MDVADMSGDFCSLLKEQREKEAKAVLRGAGGDISLVSYTGLHLIDFSPLCVFKCAERGRRGYRLSEFYAQIKFLLTMLQMNCGRWQETERQGCEHFWKLGAKERYVAAVLLLFLYYNIVHLTEHKLSFWSATTAWSTGTQLKLALGAGNWTPRRHFQACTVAHISIWINT